LTVPTKHEPSQTKLEEPEEPTDTVTAGYFNLTLYDEFDNALTAVGNPEVRVQLDINTDVVSASLVGNYPAQVADTGAITISAVVATGKLLVQYIATTSGDYTLTVIIDGVSTPLTDTTPLTGITGTKVFVQPGPVSAAQSEAGAYTRPLLSST